MGYKAMTRRLNRLYKPYKQSRCLVCDARVQRNVELEWVHARYPAQDKHEAVPNRKALKYAKKNIL